MILDLEDSVPPDQKIEARSVVRSKVAWLAEHRQRTWVRINRSLHLYDFDDILAIVGPHVEGIVMSKPIGPEDIDTVSSMLSEAEYRIGAGRLEDPAESFLDAARRASARRIVTLHRWR